MLFSALHYSTFHNPRKFYLVTVQNSQHRCSHLENFISEYLSTPCTAHHVTDFHICDGNINITLWSSSGLYSTVWSQHSFCKPGWILSVSSASPCPFSGADPQCYAYWLKDISFFRCTYEVSPHVTSVTLLCPVTDTHFHFRSCFSRLIDFILCVCIKCLHPCVCTMTTCGTHRGRKTASDHKNWSYRQLLGSVDLGTKPRTSTTALNTLFVCLSVCLFKDLFTLCMCVHTNVHENWIPWN